MTEQQQETDQRSAIERYMDGKGPRVKTGTAADHADSIGDPGELFDQATGNTSASSGSGARHGGRLTSGEDSNRKRLVDEAATRPQVEVVGAPAGVDKAWSAVVKAAEVARSAERDWRRAQGAADRAARQRHDSIAAVVEKTGKAPTDTAEDAKKYDDALLAAHAVWAGQCRRVHAARATYDSLVVEAREEWAARLLAEVEPERAKAATALRAAQGAVARLSGVVRTARHHHARGLREAGVEGVRSISPFDSHRIGDALETALSSIDGDDPFVLVDAPVHGLSLTDRKAIVDESASSTIPTARRRWLDSVEASENYTVTRQGKPVTDPPSTSA